MFFLTGTDEHGQKVEQSAAEKGMEPQALADQNAAEFQKIMGMFDLTNDAFIRTTDQRHERQVQAFVKQLMDSGDVYLGTFEGWYDAGQEEYYTETKAREVAYTSPISGRPLERATEENYYFKLSAFEERLSKMFDENPNFVSPWKGNPLVSCCDLASALDGTGYAFATLRVRALLLDQRGQEDVQIAWELHRS